MHPREFADENALNDYAERHGLECLWEGTNGFRKRRRLASLSPGQYHLATVQTAYGIRTALLFSRTIRRAEVEISHRVPHVLKRKRLTARMAKRNGQES
jgi:gamma-glutamyl:cysteine ligase YbdK (ATP-grasp superfamily)